MVTAPEQKFFDISKCWKMQMQLKRGGGVNYCYPFEKMKMLESDLKH